MKTVYFIRVLCLFIMALLLPLPVIANEPPQVQALSKTLKEDSARKIVLKGNDPERKKLAYSISRPPQFGTVSLKGKTATYKPNRDYFGPDSFQYTANDGELTSTPTTVSLTVQPVNDAPVAQSQNQRILMGVASTFTLTANDVDGDSLTFQLTRKPKKGKVVINGNLATYTPKANYLGKDNFAFKASDGKKPSKPARVDLLISESSSTENITISGATANLVITNGHVVVESVTGETLGTGTTDNLGHYAVSLKNAIPNEGYRVLVTGGQIDGNAFEDELSALYVPDNEKSGANLTLITTLVNHLAERYPQSIPLQRREAAVSQLLDIGLILQPAEWSSLNPPSINIDALNLAADLEQGVSGWLQRMLDDLEDDDVSPNQMLGFPNANGGITSITLNGSTQPTVSGFLNETIQGNLQILGQDAATYTFETVKVPDGLTLSENGTLNYTIPANASLGESIPVVIRAVNTATGKGRMFKVNIYPMSKIQETKDTLNPGTGNQVVTTPDGETTVTINTSQIKQAVHVEILKGTDDAGYPVTKYVLDKDFNGPITIDLPDPQPIQPAAKSLAKSSSYSTASTPTYPLSQQWRETWANFVKVDCGLGMGNRVQQKISAQFNLCYGNLVPTIINSTPKPASSLQAECGLNDTNCFQNKKPVLFVHGFLPSVYEMGGGEDTWGYFPQAIKNSDPDSIRVFEFRWVSAARFQDVAADLAQAIQLISQKTGQKVHIIAHSFGGILTRTYMQGLATGKSYNHDIASVTTIGTPHSGIFDSSKTAHNVTFPQGQDSQLSGDASIAGNKQINGCKQVSCYQMGEFVGFTQGELEFYHLNIPDPNNEPMDVPDQLESKQKPGKFIAVLQAFDQHPLPSHLPIQVLMGLSTTRGSNDTIDEGDGLITFTGQRLHPSLNTVKPLLSQEKQWGGIVSESLLGLTLDAFPGTPWSINNPLYRGEQIANGYRHSGWPVGPTDAAREVWVSNPCTVKIGALDCWNENDHHAVLASKQLIATSDGSIVTKTAIKTLNFIDAKLAQCLTNYSNAQNWQYVDQVTRLQCGNQTISNLSGLKQLNSLLTLDLSGNAIIDLSSLSGMTQLKELNLSGMTGLRCVDLDSLAAALSATTITHPASCVQQSSNFVDDYDGEWESPTYRYGFDLRSGSGQATLSNSSSFAPGDAILRIERVTVNGRFLGEQMFKDGTWVKVTGRLLNSDQLEMNGGGLTWIMKRIAATATNLHDFDGDWESPTYRYGFDLRSGSGQATLSNSSSFAPGDAIGTWVKVTGRLLNSDQLEMNGGGLTWIMKRIAANP
jgi:hypothetical protein